MLLQLSYRFDEGEPGEIGGRIALRWALVGTDGERGGDAGGDGAGHGEPLGDADRPLAPADVRHEAGIDRAVLVAGPARGDGPRPLPLRAAVGDGLSSESVSGTTG